MTTQLNQQTARIFTFPKGGRAVLARAIDPVRQANDPAAQRFADAAHGGGWYHDAAIEDDRPPLES